MCKCERGEGQEEICKSLDMYICNCCPNKIQSNNEELKKKLYDLFNGIDNLYYEMDKLRDTYYKLESLSKEIISSNGINDVNHFKEKLTDRGLNNSELENFIDEYIKSNNE